MMYAVIESGGKQYRVAVGDRVKVESLRAEPGADVQLDNVLLVADGDRIDVGSPYTGASVGARVVEHGRGPKVRILKFRRRQNSRTHAGHRQNYTELEITSIGGKSEGKAAPKKSAEQAPAAKADKPAKAQEESKQEAPAAKQSADEDLTRLGGVGPVMAEKLQNAGVTSLSQIAGWSEEDIARFDEELDFKGRIQRDDWVGQARKLTEQTD
ncbi:MAG: 50S ribosomal protein L21 [Gammaproteobacteria bacterium]|nr:50S ribosomal protein L21 [Gammaproteobacteria bacterium]